MGVFWVCSLPYPKGLRRGYQLKINMYQKPRPNTLQCVHSDVSLLLSISPLLCSYLSITPSHTPRLGCRLLLRNRQGSRCMYSICFFFSSFFSPAFSVTSSELFSVGNFRANQSLPPSTSFHSLSLSLSVSLSLSLSLCRSVPSLFFLSHTVLASV